MRTYLIADFGKGLKYRGSRTHTPMARAIMDGHSRARAWWLVEAESADAARQAIADPVMVPDAPPYSVNRRDGTLLGRILASGGRS